MDENTRVFAKIDEKNRILSIDGGYNEKNIHDIENWTLIDAGCGSRFDHCQTQYFSVPIYEEHGIPVYKYENGEITERTAEEIQADIEALPPPPPSYDELAAENEDARNALRIAGITADDE